MKEILQFPEDFIWGSATSAYQVEGGIEKNDWAKFFPAGQASDHYNQYERDFDLLKELNQGVYRFSIEWSRIEPRKGYFDRREIEHYHWVLRALRARGIKTMVTLHHFTNPEWLDWTKPAAVHYFSRFAAEIFKEYQDMVDFWVVINEPLVYALQSYLIGVWPPRKKNLWFFWKVIQNQISAQKKVYEDFHNLRKNVRVGIAKNNVFFEPNNQKSIFDRFSVFWASYLWNDYFLSKIKNHLDFIGLNYYFHSKIKFPYELKNENKEVSDLGWEIYPAGIYYVLRDLKKYKLPIYVTENGLADAGDSRRKDFIKNHLSGIHKAIRGGADVRGYFHWSLMDNFEWDKGNEPRFGLLEIDYKTLERKIRSSAYYYSEICQNNCLDLNR
ncbi:MAG: glycoside hydrolase family 1 protein [bacterium]